MREITLTQGYVTVVDDEDYERLSVYHWRALRSRSTTYAVRSAGRGTVMMHREILGVDTQVDHQNGSGLDNRRQNLRAATTSQNGMNRRKAKGSSRFKGVAFDRRTRNWQAYIKVDGKTNFLGRFSSEEEAARAYDEAANASFGEFARLNFP